MMNLFIYKLVVVVLEILLRNPKKVLNDFLNDLIDKDYAEQVYGVII